MRVRKQALLLAESRLERHPDRKGNGQLSALHPSGGESIEDKGAFQKRSRDVYLVQFLSFLAAAVQKV